MATNIELKLRITTLENVRSQAAKIADSGPFILEQIDYFFPVQRGRLKLRVESRSNDNNERSQRGELIAYHRSDQAEARESDYLICPIADIENQILVLRRALGNGPVVRKIRELYLAGRTRIHLDQVEHLGDFVEIEVVMQPGEESETGQCEMTELLGKLGLETAEVQSVAYADMLRELETPQS